MGYTREQGQLPLVPFIGAELRPRYTPDTMDNPLLGPDLPREELRRRAIDVLAQVEPPLEGERLWRACPVRVDVPWTRTAAGGVDLSPPGGACFSLNQVGTFVWERLLGERTLDDIAREIGREFNAEEGVIREDLIWLIHELRKQKLITLRGA